MNWQEIVYNRTTWSIVFAVVALVCLGIMIYRSKNARPTPNPNPNDHTDRNLLIVMIIFLILAMVMEPQIAKLLDIFR